MQERRRKAESATAIDSLVTAPDRLVVVELRVTFSSGQVTRSSEKLCAFRHVSGPTDLITSSAWASCTYVTSSPKHDGGPSAEVAIASRHAWRRHR